jgi:hypothetical protein
MPPAHRHGDLRVCGATTDVVGQSKVKVNGKLWAVKDDPNTHGNGKLINSGTTVRIEGKFVIVHAADSASADDKCIPEGPPHCSPDTAQGSDDVSCYG